MKVFQLIQDPDFQDYDDVMHAAMNPNQLFTTLEGAKAAAVKEANEMRAEMEEISVCDLEWKKSASATWGGTISPTHLAASDEVTGQSFRICTTEVQV